MRGGCVQNEEEGEREDVCRMMRKRAKKECVQNEEEWE